MCGRQGHAGCSRMVYNFVSVGTAARQIADEVENANADAAVYAALRGPHDLLARDVFVAWRPDSRFQPQGLRYCLAAARRFRRPAVPARSPPFSEAARPP